jgi:hypothetical protein
MTDTALYCGCGNRLGTMRKGGVFESRHKGRSVTVTQFATGGDTADPWASVRCEDCGQWTEVDKLLLLK